MLQEARDRFAMNATLVIVIVVGTAGFFHWFKTLGAAFAHALGAPL